jgi:hypothetical protein
MWKEAVVALGWEEGGKPCRSPVKITFVPAGIQGEHLPNVVTSVTAMLSRSVVLSDLNRIIDV